MAARTTRTRAKAKAAPEPEVTDEDDDLETLEEDEVTDAKPATKSTAQEVTFGVRDLCDLIKTETGKDVTPREIRTLIRKMARDGSGRVEREIVPGNRSRYDWSGPNDPEVRKILVAFGAGELEADKQEKLAALKERKAAQTAAKKKAAAAAEVEEDDTEEDEAPAAKPAPRRRAAAKKTTATRRTRKPAPEPEPVEDDEELDFDDSDEDDDE